MVESNQAACRPGGFARAHGLHWADETELPAESRTTISRAPGASVRHQRRQRPPADQVASSSRRQDRARPSIPQSQQEPLAASEVLSAVSLALEVMADCCWDVDSQPEQERVNARESSPLDQ